MYWQSAQCICNQGTRQRRLQHGEGQWPHQGELKLHRSSLSLNQYRLTNKGTLYRRLVARTYPPCWVLKARIQKHRGKPLLFHDKCPGFFYVHYTTHGTSSFTSHPMDPPLSLSPRGARSAGPEICDVQSNPIQSTFVKRHQSSCLFRGASQKHRGKPLLLTISELGSFTCITQHTGPTALRPIRRTKQLWLSVLLKDTSAATGNRTHILVFWQHQNLSPVH